MKNNGKLIKILGLVAAAGGAAMTLLADWVNDRKMDEKINECVDAKLAALNEEDENEDDEEES